MIVAVKRMRRRLARMSVVIEEPAWREDASALRLLRRAARLALASPAHVDAPSRAAQRDDAAEAVTILLSDDAKLKTLNRVFRGKNKPTNVLSFPSEDTAYLGDIAIAHETVTREALSQGKSFANHVAHLAIHGILHLLGYDHEELNQAKIMETLEIQLLAQLGIPSPYEPSPLTRRKKAA